MPLFFTIEHDGGFWVFWRGIPIFRRNHGRSYLFDAYGPPLEMPR